jgi:hypothetical protein
MIQGLNDIRRGLVAIGRRLLQQPAHDVVERGARRRVA